MQGRTFLHWAIIHACDKLFSQLLTHLKIKTILDVSNIYDATALHGAVLTRGAKRVRMLLEAGARTDIRIRHEIGDLVTPLHYALYRRGGRR